MALQIPHYNHMKRAVKYRRDHGGICGLDYSGKPLNISSDGYTSGNKVTAYKQYQKRLSDGERSQIVEKYSAGASVYDLAEEFGCHRSTISRTLKNAGVKVSHKASSREALTRRVLEMYADYIRPVDIGKELGIHETTVQKILHENGVRIRSSGEYKGRR